MSMTMEILAKALKPVLGKALKVAGKEISKKAIAITGGVVGTAALAGGTTAVVVHHNRKKNAENKTEEAASENATETTTEEVVEVVEKKDNVVDLTKLDKKLTEIDPADQAPVEEAGAEKVDHPEVETPVAPVQNIAPQPQIINPAPQGPNPVYQFMQNPTMGFMPGFMPDGTMQNPVYQMPQQAPVVEQPKEEVKVEEEIPTVEGEVIDNKEVVITPADIAQGKKPKAKNGKGKAVEIPTTK